VYRCSGVKLSTLNVVDFSRVLTAAPHPDLDLSDDERALDLEKLAYGDYPVLGLTTDRARWEAELGDLMTVRLRLISPPDCCGTYVRMAKRFYFSGSQRNDGCDFHSGSCEAVSRWGRC
jgi:hypothetical protein